MKCKNKQLPFFAYSRKLSAILFVKEREDYGKQSSFSADVISVNFATPGVNHYYPYFKAIEIAKMEEIDVLNSKQKRTAFISILNYYKANE